MRAVSSIKKKVTPTAHGPIVETTLTLWNKPQALKMGGEHLGLFTKREDQGQEISDLLKAVLLELHTQREHAAAIPADYQPLPRPALTRLPPPPAPEDKEPCPWETPSPREPQPWEKPRPW